MLRIASVLAVLLVVAPVTFAQQWTGAAGAGVPDESAAGIYDAGVGSVGYNASGSTAAIVLRYVLTDTSATGIPPWTTIAVDGWDPNPGSLIRARLYRLTPGGTNNMVTACSTNDSAGYTTTACPLLGTVNFTTGDTYTVEVTITRTATTDAPRFRSVRLY